MKPTWTLLPDVSQPSGKPNVEAMQEEYLIERIGLTLWGALAEREGDERANNINDGD